MTIVKAKPYDFECQLAKTALIIIDMQNDFVAPGGFGELLGNDMSVIRTPIAPLQKLLKFARENNLFVIHTREGHRPDLLDCPITKQRRSKRQGAGIGDLGPNGRILIRGEQGHQIIDELTPIEGEPIIDKPGKGSFYQTDLDLILRNRGIESLLVTGVTTHVCVESTIREANDRGYECLLLEDCTAAFDPKDKEKVLWTVQQQGAIFGWVSDSVKFMEAAKK
ncbi:MAG: cysteine hydrolase [Firmicutes bacterium]|nr:cysteine hydrolase [Bacillota bacterium]